MGGEEQEVSIGRTMNPLVSALYDQNGRPDHASEKFRPEYGRKNGNPIAMWGFISTPILNVTPARFRKIHTEPYANAFR